MKRTYWALLAILLFMMTAIVVMRKQGDKVGDSERRLEPFDSRLSTKPANVAAISQASKVDESAPAKNVQSQPTSYPLFGLSGRVTIEDVPAGRFRHQLERLSPGARASALATLERLRVPLNNVESLTVDDSGNLIYECVPPKDAPIRETPAASQPLNAPTATPIASPPALHSRPGAAKVIYLDFNGHEITGTAWNLAKGTPGDAGYRPAVTTYVARPFDLDGDVTTFNDEERATIVQIWARTAEDYIVFDVDVTTEQPAEFTPTTGRVLITTSKDANGVNMPSYTASGVAYLAKFGAANYVAGYSPALVYFDRLNNYGPYIAETVSHEMGHNLGLTHDGTITTEYYEGHGSGPTSWGPIMGASFYANVTQWSKGEYFNANNPQDDLAIIAGYLGYSPDDRTDSAATAPALAVSASGFTSKGVIETTGDADRFLVTVPTKALQISATPFVANGLTTGGNSDLILQIYDTDEHLVAQSSDQYGDTTAATLNVGLTAGTYALRVFSTGTGQPMANPPSGYTAYGSLGQYILSGTLMDVVGPSITQQPQSQVQKAGEQANFYFIADGKPAPNAWWQRQPAGTAEWQDLSDGGPYAGCGTAFLRVTAAVNMNGDQFRCLLSNLGGSVTSRTVQLNVSPADPPQIYNMPAVVPVEYGQSFYIAPTISGTFPMTFVWKKDGVVLPNDNSSGLSRGNVTQADAGTYSLSVSNLAGTAYSTAATVIVAAPKPPFVAGLSPLLIAGSGQGLYLYAAVSGTGPFTMQWYKNGMPVNGWTSASFSINAAAVGDSGVYRLVVNSPYGTANSTDVTVVITPPVAPAIYGIGGVRSIAYGSSFYLSPTVTGSATISYQWYKDGLPLASATGSSVSFNSATAAQAGRYKLVATNAVGSATSNEIEIVVEAARPPEIYAVPVDRTVSYGSYISLSCSVSGTSPLTYQWKKNGVIIPNATGNYLSLNNVTVSDGGTYHLIVTNPAGSATSPGIVLTVEPPNAPYVYNLPATLVVAYGNYMSLSPTYFGSQPMTYQWYKDGAGIPGANSSYYQRHPATAADAGRYKVTATNLAGSYTSREVNVLVDEVVAPAITGLPASVTVAYGESLSLAPIVTGSPELVYQWKRNDALLAGATSGSFSKSSMTAADAGSYTLTVSNDAGAVTSQPVVVTVSPAIAPSIANMPSTIMVDYNASLNFGPYVTGTQPRTYVWRRNGTVIDAAVSGGYYRSQATTADNGTYILTVSNIAGSATSTACTVTVNSPVAPQIYNLPASLVVKYGETLSLNPGVAGTQPIAFTWRKGGVALPQGQSGNYNKSMVTSDDAGSYTLTATNLAGTATSAAVAVTVLAPEVPVISGLPSAVAVRYGDSLSLYPSVTGTEPIIYQWKKDGAELAGATTTNRNLYRSSLTTADSGLYTLTATNLVGSTTSAAVNVMVQDPQAPAIYDLPASRDIDYGGSLYLSPSVVGTGPLVYQWRKDGVVIPDASSSYLNRSNLTPADSGDYTLTVSNAFGSVTSAAIRVTVRPAIAPTIVEQPRSLQCFPGYTANFRVVANGTGSMSYRWYFNGAALPEISSVLSVAEVGPAKAGAYRVVISNPAGSVTSADAQLTMDPGLAVTAVSAGSGFSCWVRSDRSLWSTGENSYGQLGDGSRISRSNAMKIADEVTAVSAGATHILFVRTDGSLWAMGDNDYGQLGTGSHAPEASPVRIFEGVQAVAAGNKTSFFITTDHTLWAMGYNDGRLGDGTYEPRARPVQIATDVIKVAAGSNHALYIRSDGTLWGVGQNYSGQLGIGTYWMTPNPVQITSDVAEVAAGSDHSAYIKSDGSLWSMGQNYNGVLGDGTSDSRSLPVLTATGVKAVAAGSNFKLYVAMDGKLWAMGSNADGQLGLANYGSRLSPELVTEGVAMVSGGSNHSLFITTTGELWGMGRGGGAAFGNGQSSSVNMPFQLTWHSATAPVITSQPVSRSVQTGDSTSFTVGVTSALPYALQWRRDGQPIAGATASTYQIPSVTAGQAGAYDVLITYVEGTVQSLPAQLSVGSSFAAWAGSSFSAEELADPLVSGPQADPDGDGLVNLVEYALGTAPKAVSAAQSPAVGLDATHWSFTFNRPADRSDLTYEVEVSSDLANWRAPAVAATLVSSAEGAETWQAMEPLTTGTVFFRLKVTQL